MLVEDAYLSSKVYCWHLCQKLGGFSFGSSTLVLIDMFFFFFATALMALLLWFCNIAYDYII